MTPHACASSGIALESSEFQPLAILFYGNSVRVSFDFHFFSLPDFQLQF